MKGLNHDKQGYVRSFGRTASRMSQEDQEKLNTRLKTYAFSMSDLKNHKGEVELEVGMGNGLAVFERAKKCPNQLYIGIEVYKNGLRSLVNALEKNPDVKNVRISHEDARDFLTTFPKKSVNRVCVLYPDPWPKTRHNKRRILQEDFLTTVDALLKDDGELVAVTDIVDYMHWILAKTHNHGVFKPIAIEPNDWATPPTWWVPTKYEKKAYREGRRPWYLIFKRHL